MELICTNADMFNAQQEVTAALLSLLSVFLLMCSSLQPYLVLFSAT